MAKNEIRILFQSYDNDINLRSATLSFYFINTTYQILLIKSYNMCQHSMHEMLRHCATLHYTAIDAVKKTLYYHECKTLGKL